MATKTATVLHTCNGADHTAPVQVHEATRIGCGCIRYRGHRCDGTRIEWVDGTCAFHRGGE